MYLLFINMKIKIILVVKVNVLIQLLITKARHRGIYVFKKKSFNLFIYLMFDNKIVHLTYL